MAKASEARSDAKRSEEGVAPGRPGAGPHGGERAAVGVASHAGWAGLVSVALRGGVVTVIDRRRVETIDPGLPCQPYHHQATELPLVEAQALVDRVEASVAACSRRALAKLGTDLAPVRLVALAIREEPTEIPETLAEVLGSYRAMCAADGEMYRRALRRAAVELGIQVALHRKGAELENAAKALQCTEARIQKRIAELGRELGPPWPADHRDATAAAIAALARLELSR
jgi:hypothetical protein